MEVRQNLLEAMGESRFSRYGFVKWMIENRIPRVIEEGGKIPWNKVWLLGERKYGMDRHGWRDLLKQEIGRWELITDGKKSNDFFINFDSQPLKPTIFIFEIPWITLLFKDVVEFHYIRFKEKYIYSML